MLFIWEAMFMVTLMSEDSVVTMMVILLWTSINLCDFGLVMSSHVAFPEKYVTENFQEIFPKISGNFLCNRKNVFIHNVSMKTAENTGKLLHSFKFVI